MAAIRFWRRSLQFCVALAFVAIPFLNKAEINMLSGNFLAFNFSGLPLSDPLAVLQVFAGTGAATTSMLVGAGLVLAVALLLGPVFCSWLCPYGFLSELFYGGQGARANVAVAPGSVTLAGGGAQAGQGCVSLVPFAVRLTLVCTGVLAIVFFVPVPVLDQFSMPGWYSRVMQHAALYGKILAGVAILFPATLLLEKIAGTRFWCRYVCPQSVLLSLAGMVLPGRFSVVFTRSSCTCPTSDRACLSVCSLRLNPRAPRNLGQRLQCINCGDCIDACRAHGRALCFDRQLLRG